MRLGEAGGNRSRLGEALWFRDKGVLGQRLDSMIVEGFSNPNDPVILKPGPILGRTLAAKAVWRF